MNIVANDWQRTRLRDVAHVVHGWPFQSESYASRGVDLPIVVSIGNFEYSGGFRFDRSTVKHYKGPYPREYELTPGDLLLVMTCQTEGGEILGIPGRVPDDGLTYLHNQRIGRLAIDHPDLLDTGFAFHMARTKDFNRQLFVTASGSKILHTSPGRIGDIQFLRPPLAEQREIAEILDSLEDKIAANTNLTYAVDDFLGLLLANHRASTPGEEIALKDIADVNAESLKPTFGGSLRYIDITSVGVGNFDFPEIIDWEGAPSRARRRVRRGDTLWSTVRPNRRSHALNLSNDRLLVGSTGLAVLSPRETGFAYLYEVTKLPEFTTYLESAAQGSAYPAVRADRFGDVPVPLLPASAREHFESIAAPMREHAFSLNEQNRTLATTRDALLPQLMSGKIRVTDAEMTAGEVL